MAHIIQNFEKLAENDQRRDALAIAEAGYEAINVGNALRRKLKIEDDELIVDASARSHLTDAVRRHLALAGRKVFFVGVGKCAFAAAEAIEQFLGDRLESGIAFDVSPTPPKLTKIKTFVGTHPLPSEVNVQATTRIIEFLLDRTEEDLVIMLISGGGSTLLCSPEEPMTSDDESTLFKELTAHGATIQEMNTVRKHISRARGGGLARDAYPAEVISLIVSDVPKNDIAFVSSGPTVQDTSTISDAEAILMRYGIRPPANIRFMETPKEANYFDRVANILFLTNQDALSAMHDEAVQRGYAAEIVDDHFTGEARELGRAVVEKLHDAPAKTALLYAGESTVTLGEHSGTGGRNQEMALATLKNIRQDEIILPFSSDGHDDTDAAGAIGDSISFEHARTHDLSIEDSLEAHCSYDFFSTTGDALHTGYTGSNVSDLIVALKN
ncbi:MAG: DUF4147 domain-containing protein [Candidatus Paceibacterota bacterium]